VTAGSVYLVGSAHGGTLREAFRRIDLGSTTPPRIATSYAALAHAPADEARQAMAIKKLFRLPGWVERFSVAGEEGATSPEEARAVVERADVIFFGGGDPVLAAHRLVGAGADSWIRDARARGAKCVGLSAGAIVLGAFWASWPEDEPHAVPAVVQCVGAVPDLVVDCHAEDDEWEELHAVQRGLGPRAKGMRFAGIASGAALIVGPDGALEWIGHPHVLDAT
jgi:cyanophycinase-like exopeptidase